MMRDPEDSVFWGEIEGVSINDAERAGVSLIVGMTGVSFAGIATTDSGSLGGKEATGGFAG